MSALESLPASILAKVPAATPPNGTIPNFIDPPNSGRSFIIYGGLLLPIMLGFFAIRLYCRFRILRRPGLDDLTCLISTFGTVAYYAISAYAIDEGHLGRHTWDLSLLDISRPKFQVPGYIINWLSTLILPFVKTTLLLFYLHIFRPFRWLRILCYIGIVFTNVSFLGFWMAQMVLGTPHPGETWLQMEQSSRYLFTLRYLSIPITTTSLAIDIYVFFLPMMGVAKLQLSARQRCGVVLIFLTGFTACVASALSLYYKVLLNSQTSDVSWAVMPVEFTILTEMSVGIIVSCMPSLACFVRHHFSGFSVFNTLKLLKSSLFTAQKPLPSSAPCISGPHSQNVHLTSREKLHTNSKIPEASLNMCDIEMGHVAHVTAYADGDGAAEMDRFGRIRIQHAWEQTSYSTEVNTRSAYGTP